MKNLLIIFTTSLLYSSPILSQECEWCPRQASLEVFVDDEYAEDVANFAQRMGEMVSTKCFSIGYDLPEYSFGILFEIYEEEGGRYLPGFADNQTWSLRFQQMEKEVIENKYGPYQSRLLVALFYVGGEITGTQDLEGEPALGNLIDYWYAYGEGRTVTENEEPIMDQIRKSMPLDELVWDWEQPPIKFELYTDNICVDPESNVFDFNLKDGMIRGGKACGTVGFRDINRLVFNIDGPDGFELDPADKTEDGNFASRFSSCDQKFTLKAPPYNTLFNEVSITVYNSCEIRKTHIMPLFKTEKKNEIGKNTIRNEWRLPHYCDIEPAKKRIHVNEIMTVKIKNIQDAIASNSMPYDRLFVKVDHGKILNGKKIAGMNAFEVGEGEIEVLYQAPAECKTTEENMNVFSSCSTSDSLAMEPGDHIQDKSFDVYCEYEWSGTMTVEKLERFDCQLDNSTDNSWGKTKLHELSTTRATVNILAENIDDSPPGFNINMGENLVVSGFMKCEYNNIEIKNGRKSGVNPSTSYYEETLVGEDLFNLTHKNLNLMFTANMGDLQQDGSLEEMAKMLESGNMDQAKLEDFGKKLEESMGTGDEGTSKITVIMILFGDCNCKAILTQNGWRVENGERTTTNESTTLDLPIGGGVALDFTADYIRKKDGSATITGNYHKTIPISGGQRGGCPPKEETITCTLNLSKRQKQ